MDNVKFCVTCHQRIIWSELCQEWLHLEGPLYAERGITLHNVVPSAEG